MAYRTKSMPFTLKGICVLAYREFSVRFLRCRSFVAASLSAFLTVASAPATFAQTPSGTTVAATAPGVNGTVVDQANGLPVPRAQITVLRGTTKVESTTTDASGAFAIANVTPGFYVLQISAPGYETSSSREFTILQGQSVTLNLAVSAARSSQNNGLRTIGSVSVSGSSAIASTTAITRTLDPATVEKENNLRLVDQLVRLPGVNGAGLSSSVGDDTYINIRGLGQSETVALLDGHPVGPQGVYGINGGGSFPSSFNYADTPVYGLSKVQVTFGSGGTGLYGVDAIGGTIDLQTLAPTQKPSFNVLESLGNQGRQQTAATLTGSAGRLGYAFAGGVQGTFGLFTPQSIAQTGRPNNDNNGANGGICTKGNDVSACNFALNTYNVSQNVLVKGGLAKLQYGLSDNMTFTATAYDSGVVADSTGNGDNDNIPYDTRLAQIQTNQTPNCNLAGSSVANGYTVITNRNGATSSCYSASQWAAASSGPYGGGAGRARGTNMSDYHFRVQSTGGKNTLTADGFHNYYKYWKTSEEAAGYTDPSRARFAGTSYTQYLNTDGYLISDDIQNEKSDVGFGYFGEYQLGTRLNYDGSTGLHSYIPSESTHYDSGFARAELRFSPAFSTYANFWIKHSSVDNTTSFDPRISLVFRPQPSDVLRLTFGHSTGDPAAELKATGVNINGNPSSLNPSCTAYNPIGTGGNPSIKPERANDYEAGYAHRFGAESSVQLNLYYTAVGDQLFSAGLPITQYAGNVTVPPDLLLGFANKIASAGCAGVNAAVPSTVIPYLAITTTYNAARATAKGVELTGRQRLAKHFFAEYGYNLQSVVQNGILPSILQTNAFITNGGQVLGIPVNQANVALDYNNKGFETRVDGYVVGSNNPKERPGYNTWDGFISKTLEHDVSLTFGITNIFNESIQNYGYFGSQVFLPENQFFHDTSAIGQYVNTGSGERFGQPSRAFSFTASYRM